MATQSGSVAGKIPWAEEACATIHGVTESWTRLSN